MKKKKNKIDIILLNRIIKYFSERGFKSDLYYR